MMKKIIATALMGGSMLATSPAFAASSNPGTLNVSLMVTSGCDINGNGGIGAGSGTAASIDFGSYAPGTGSGNTSVSGSDTGTSLVVTCSGTQTPNLVLNGGANATGSQRNLKQVNGTGTIAYILGSSVGGAEYAVNTAVSLGSFTANQGKQIKIYGSVPGGVPVGAEGAYTDTVQIAMSW
ncbi:spore coat protein U domain-containing protein [Sphingomonas parapaucimobilis]|uniref:spore coat protein U domain-containing protein n=1 Tax=Sphingomonas parapaucimobilis TaxID=28213 RepID=UPI00321ACC8F